MKRNEAIQAMNSKGKAQEPFFFVVDYSMEHSMVCTASEAFNSGILFHFPNANNLEGLSCTPKKLQLWFNKNPVGFDRYRKAFLNVQSHLHMGNSYLVNLTFPSEIEINLSLEEIFHAANAKYKLLYKNKFVVFSPESFVKINPNGIISTYPMKGTIDASLPNAKQKLMNNAKELAEHATIVDLLRNDLSLFASNVRVEKFRYIERIKSNQKELLQVSSKITGKLPDNFNSKLGDIIFAMLPAGSITGAPKEKTVEIISESENYERGYYTGIAGWFDGESLDSCVLIRFIERIDDKFVYKSGGGITSQSKTEEEYQELIDKIYVPIN